MANIVDLIREQKMSQPTPPLPIDLNEKSQVVITPTTPQQPNILRFKSVKDGLKAYDKILKAWREWHAFKDYFGTPKGTGKKPPERFIEIYCEMFVSCVDLDYVSTVNFVDIAKRHKFVYYTG